MKRGETVPVTIAGQVVAQAKIVELDNTTVTLIVPATQVVMAVRTELDTAPVEESGKQVIIDGVDRSEGDGVDRSEGEEETPVAEEVEQPAAVEGEVETDEQQG